MPIFSEPCVIRTASGFHSVKAFSGAADHDGHDAQ
jgi:hypothetical protein